MTAPTPADVAAAIHRSGSEDSKRARRDHAMRHLVDIEHAAKSLMITAADVRAQAAREDELMFDLAQRRLELLVERTIALLDLVALEDALATITPTDDEQSPGGAAIRYEDMTASEREFYDRAGRDVETRLRAESAEPLDDGVER